MECNLLPLSPLESRSLEIREKMTTYKKAVHLTFISSVKVTDRPRKCLSGGKNTIHVHIFTNLHFPQVNDSVWWPLLTIRHSLKLWNPCFTLVFLQYKSYCSNRSVYIITGCNWTQFQYCWRQKWFHKWIEVLKKKSQTMTFCLFFHNRCYFVQPHPPPRSECQSEAKRRCWKLWSHRAKLKDLLHHTRKPEST